MTVGKQSHTLHLAPPARSLVAGTARRGNRLVGDRRRAIEAAGFEQRRPEGGQRAVHEHRPEPTGASRRTRRLEQARAGTEKRAGPLITACAGSNSSRPASSSSSASVSGPCASGTRTSSAPRWKTSPSTAAASRQARPEELAGHDVAAQVSRVGAWSLVNRIRTRIRTTTEDRRNRQGPAMHPPETGTSRSVQRVRPPLAPPSARSPHLRRVPRAVLERVAATVFFVEFLVRVTASSRGR
jgi:hypothetical protein